MARSNAARKSAPPRKARAEVLADKPVNDVLVSKPVRLPTHAEIARRAFELYQARGGAHGCDLNDWLSAERELRAPH
jgi:hypothetical protein